jgi:hypothetical protein
VFRLTWWQAKLCGCMPRSYTTSLAVCFILRLRPPNVLPDCIGQWHKYSCDGRASVRSFMESMTTTPTVIRPPNVLGVSGTAGPACRSRSGTAVAANDVQRTEWRTATAVTPSLWR